jgi:hypothetical protein
MTRPALEFHRTDMPQRRALPPLRVARISVVERANVISQ